MVRQKIKAWENVGISRATWYRKGKPTEPQRPAKTANMRTVADQAKTLGASSTRSYQRMMRVLSSDMGWLLPFRPALNRENRSNAWQSGYTGDGRSGKAEA